MNYWKFSHREVAPDGTPVEVWLRPDGGEHVANIGWRSPTGQMADVEPTEQPVESAVETVIDHLSHGRVAPKQVDRLSDAVSRARMDRALSDALNRRL